MPQYELNLQDYWRVIRKRRWIIIVVFIAVLVPTIIYTRLQPSVYQAQAQVAITERKSGGDWLRETFYYTPGDPMKSYAEAITSQEVVKRAAVKLGLISPESIEREKLSEEEINTVLALQGSISAKVVENTNKIAIFATADQPVTACEYANAVADGFEQYNLAEKTKQEREARTTIEKQLREAERLLKEKEEALQDFRKKYEVTDITSAYSRLETLKKDKDELLKKYTSRHPDVVYIDKQIESLRQEVSKYAEDEITFTHLKRQVQVYSTLYNELKPKLANAEIEAAKAPDVSIIDRATRASQVGAKKGLNWMIGIILGLVVGLALAFVTEHLDTSIGTIEEIETLLKLPVLGVIPYLSKDKEKSTSPWRGIFKKGWTKAPVGSHSESVRSQLILNYNTLSPITEAYRILRTNVIKNGASGNGGKIIIITSTGPAEGKTITAINLSITMAEKGERVLLVDADMRKAMIHKVFSIDKGPGLSDLLIGTRKIEETVRDITDTLMGAIPYEVITKTPGIDNLHILTAGSSVPHPAELISSTDIDSLFRDLKMNYDYIILDCAPVLPVTDVLILGSKVNSVVLIYRAGKTAKSALMRTAEQLKNAQIAIKGVVLNYITPEIEITPNYYYHYYKYYPSENKG